MNINIETSLSLLQRVLTNDQAAWVRFVNVYSPMVYEWCRRSGLQPADAADVGQEVFAAVARNIARFRRDQPGNSFRGWLFTITRNKIRTLVASRRAVGFGDEMANWLAVIDSQPTTSDDEEADSTIYLAAIESVRSEFETHTWQAFWLVAVEGRTPADVAGALGLTVNTVYLAKSRVLKRLREEFASLIDFDIA